MCVVHTHVSKSVQNTVMYLLCIHVSCLLLKCLINASVKFIEYFMLLRNQMVNLYMPAEIHWSGHTRWVNKLKINKSSKQVMTKNH